MGYDFSKAKGVELSQRGQYLSEVKDPVTGAVTPGQFDLRIIRNMVFRDRKQRDFWIAEFEVIASNNPQHPVGSLRNWMQNISDPQVGFRAVKAYVFAALGLDHKEPEDKKVIESEIEPSIDTVLAEALEDPKDPACKNALKGAVVKCEVTKIKTKEKNADFSLHAFSPKK